MINPTPWHRDPTNLLRLVDANGHKVCEMTIAENAKEKDRQNIHHIYDCVLAIHDAGIQPADVAAMVEAVRAWKEYKQSKTMLEEVKRNSAFESAIKTAAALLPERKESK